MATWRKVKWWISWINWRLETSHSNASRHIEPGKKVAQSVVSWSDFHFAIVNQRLSGSICASGMQILFTNSFWHFLAFCKMAHAQAGRRSASETSAPLDLFQLQCRAWTLIYFIYMSNCCWWLRGQSACRNIRCAPGWINLSSIETKVDIWNARVLQHTARTWTHKIFVASLPSRRIDDF